MKDSDLFFNAFFKGRIALFLTLFALANMAGLMHGITAHANPYEVNNVKVDIVAQSSVEARDKAFKAAQTLAFDDLSKHFLNESELKAAATPKFETIARMVRDVELINEKTSSRRYVGTFNIRFKPSAVRSHFGKGPRAEFTNNEATDKIMVLPFFEQNGHINLWDESKNPFLKIWRSQNGSEFLIPAGDTLDKMDIKTDLIKSYNKGLIKRLKGRYKISEIIIVAARYDGKATPQLSVDLYRTDLAKLKKTKTLEFNVETEKTLGLFMARVIPAVITELNGNWKEAPPPPVTDFNSVLTQNTGDDIIENKPEIQEPVKGETYAAQSGTATAIVQFASVNDWIAMRRRIASTPSVTAVKLNNLSTFEANINLSYIDKDMMLRNLQASGFTVRQISEHSYLIMRAR